MLHPIMAGIIIIILSVGIHAIGSTLWIRSLKNRFIDTKILIRPSRVVGILITTALFLILLHLAEVVLWALAYMMIPEILAVHTFSESLYFSIVTYTTLGYGDITLDEPWRLLSGMEAVNGILLFGWSTAMLFAVVQRIWRDIHSIPEDTK